MDEDRIEDPLDRLIAIDVGLKCGFARFASDGRLEWFQARDLGSRARLKKAAEAILRDQPPLEGIVIEGGGDLAEIWKRAARRLGVPLEQVSAETWRPDLLLPRQQRGSVKAKQAAHKLAEKVIAEHGSKSATRLRTDAAEAILVGYWAAKRRGWI